MAHPELERSKEAYMAREKQATFVPAVEILTKAVGTAGDKHGSRADPRDFTKGNLVPYKQYITARDGQVQTDIFTRVAKVEFVLQELPHLFLPEPYLRARITLDNTHATDAITPAHAEWLFDETTAVQFCTDTNKIFYTVPAWQILLQPMFEMETTQWAYYSVTNLNHDANLSSNPAAIPALGAGPLYYDILIPMPVPHEGIWLGFFKKKPWTVAFNTVDARAAGTGTLVCTGFELCLDCLSIPKDEQPALAAQWQHIHWENFEYTINRQSQITTASSGNSDAVEAKSFLEKNGIASISFLRASRSITSHAYMNLLAFPATSYLSIKPRDGQIMLESKLPSRVTFRSTELFLKHLPQTAFGAQVTGKLANFWFHFFVPKFYQAIQHHLIKGGYGWAGTEQYIISNYGSATATYVDSINIGTVRFGVLNDGTIEINPRD